MGFNPCADLTFTIHPDYALLFPNSDNRIQE